VHKLGEVQRRILPGDQISISIVNALGWLESLSFKFLLVDELTEEPVVVAFSLVLFEPPVWHDLEKETEHSVTELGCIRVSFGKVSSAVLFLKLVHDMHLEIEELAIKGVLRWRMEMELHSVEVGALDMRVEQGDRAGMHVVVLYKLVVSVLDVLEWEHKGL